VSFLGNFVGRLPLKVISLMNFKKRKIWNRDKTLESWNAFVEACKGLRKEVRRVKKQKIRSKLSKNTKDFWKEVGAIMGKSNVGIERLEIEGKHVEDKQAIAETFIDFFLKKVKDNIGDYSPKCWRDVCNGLKVTEYDQWEDFSLEEVSAAFSRLSNKKSSGMDAIPGFILKELMPTLLIPVRVLFNRIAETKLILEIWKIARITPVLKKGSQSNVNNYRPVSNLNSLAKLFELCVLARMECLDLDKLMGRSQHGFRPNHSTNTAVSTVISEISEHLDNKDTVICYSADLTAAFDLLRKETLAEIMVSKGISIHLTRIVFEYLSTRYGYVQIGEQRSCVREIKLGCVQGSILGPFLFNLYTSELSRIISPWQTIAYADDAYVIINDKDEKNLIENFKITMTKHEKWLKSIGMISNRSKTEALIFGGDNIKEIEIEGVKIEFKDTMKMLGIWVDKNLRWNTHVEKTISKCRSLGYAFRFLNKYLSRKEMRQMFLSHFVGRLTYGGPVWYLGTNFKQKQSIKSVYFKQIRIILRDFNRKLNRERLAGTLGVGNPDQLFFSLTSGFLFNILTSCFPTDLFESLLSRSYFNERNEGCMLFFRDSVSRTSWSNITTVAHEVAQKWNFSWINISKYVFKNKIKVFCEGKENPFK